MIRLVAAATLLLGVGGPDQALTQETRFAQPSVAQRIIIRVPRGRPIGIPAGSSPVEWREGGAPRCLQADRIAAATIGGQSIDFIMRDNRRVRAHLARRCEGLNYYRGFYLDRPRDGRICAERDVIRSRMGGQCEIAELRTLEPVQRSRADRR